MSNWNNSIKCQNQLIKCQNKLMTCQNKLISCQTIYKIDHASNLIWCPKMEWNYTKLNEIPKQILVCRCASL